MTPNDGDSIKRPGESSLTKRNRWLGVATIVSTLLLVVTIATSLATIFADFGAWRTRRARNRQLHIRLLGLKEGSCFGSIVVFNDEYGPYTGPFGLFDQEPERQHPEYHLSAWHDQFGISYCSGSTIRSGKPFRTAAISLVYPFVLFAVLPIYWTWTRWHLGERAPLITWLAVCLGLVLNVWSARMALWLLNCAPGSLIRPMGASLAIGIAASIGLFIGIPLSIAVFSLAGGNISGWHALLRC